MHQYINICDLTRGLNKESLRVFSPKVNLTYTLGFHYLLVSSWSLSPSDYLLLSASLLCTCLTWFPMFTASWHVSHWQRQRDDTLTPTKDNLQTLRGIRFSSNGQVGAVPVPVIINTRTRKQSPPVLSSVLGFAHLNPGVHEARISVQRVVHRFSIFMWNHCRQPKSRSARKVLRKPSKCRGDLIVMRWGRERSWVNTRGDDYRLANYAVFKWVIFYPQMRLTVHWIDIYNVWAPPDRRKTFANRQKSYSS